MKNILLKRGSICNLVVGYMLAAAFIILMLLNIKPAENVVELTDSTPEPMFIPVENNTTVYVEDTRDALVRDVRYFDHLDGIVIDQHDKQIAIIDDTTINKNFHEGHIQNNWQRTRISGDDVRVRDDDIRDGFIGRNNDRHHEHAGGSVRRSPDVVVDDVDIGLLDRRLAEIQDDEQIGLDKHEGLDLTKLALAKDQHADELGELDIDFNTIDGQGYGVGKQGQLYAYNYPSQGVGAGIGSGAVGAGSGAGAGIGAGIGEAMLDGETVPTLGGVGTYTPPTEPGQPAPAAVGGVGGLIGGAGAGGAAGLVTGTVQANLGTGPGAGLGGGGSRGRGYNYRHLPENGELHIMMHVDGSGSILNTRKQLDIMKDTLLKDALLPYYNNDVNLYNRRVTIVSSSGERTLKFFTEAASKNNVLAIAFQDEAQPAYHLPNFNKRPEQDYLDDLKTMKYLLSEYNGLYRGIMFQVDRGNTFAKSFKEFVGNAFRGEGYLQSDNLKKYYRDNNTNLIRNRKGVVFSDEYHAKDAGDPKYYLDLIFEASKRVGLDLDIYGAGLSDGVKTSSSY